MTYNKKPNRTADATLQIRLPAGLKNDFDKYCEINCLKKSDLIRNILANHLMQHYYPFYPMNEDNNE